MLHHPLSRFCVAVLLLALTAVAAHSDATTQRIIETSGGQAIVDYADVRIDIKVDDDFDADPEDAQLASNLFPSYAAAYEAAQKHDAEILPSVSLLAAKCKKFDDGMYAAIDLAVEEPIGAFQIGRRELLWQLLTALNSQETTSDFGEQAARLAVSRVWAAHKLAGYPLKFPSRRIDPEFMKDLSRKPISFYTWNTQLERIFKRDTALQAWYRSGDDSEYALYVAAAAFIVRALDEDPVLKREHGRLNNLFERLSNKLEGVPLDTFRDEAETLGGLDVVINQEGKARELGEAIGPESFAVLRRSTAKEHAAVLEGGMDEFVQAVRSGGIDLKPDRDSGWYEYQQHALEPLLLPDKMPEGEKLVMDDKYRKLLEASFRSIISQVRETHIKAGPPPEGMMPAPVTVAPILSAEPWPTSYLRFAEAYAFLRGALRRYVGREALELHARDEGAVERQHTIGAEIASLRKLLIGAQFLACRDIGIQPLADVAGQSGRRSRTEYMDYAQQWLDTWQDDPDMARDVRMMVPVSVYPNRFWAVIGVRLHRLTVSYEDPPEIVGRSASSVLVDEVTYWLPTEEFIEVTDLDEPLNRKEFRKLCDGARTPGAIATALRGKGALVSDAQSLDEAAVPLSLGSTLAVIGAIILLLCGLVAWRIIRSATRK